MDLGKERDERRRGSREQLGTEEKRWKGGNGPQARGGPSCHHQGLLAHLDELDGQKRVLLNQESHKTF